MAGVVSNSFEPKYVATAAEDFDGSEVSTYKRMEEWTRQYIKTSPLDFPFPHGVPYGPGVYPKTVKIVKGKKLYDYNGYLEGGPTVSARLKALIEEFDPGVHQFVPVEVFNKDGTPYGEPFWYFRVCALIDAVNPELGGVKKFPGYDYKNHPDRYTWVIKSGGFDTLAVHKHIVEGRGCWVDKRYSNADFFSDALLKRMQEEGIEGYDITQVWAEL